MIKDSHGTGCAAHRAEVLLAGKTGTAESTEKHPSLIVSMAEEGKGRGGSGYIVGEE